MHLKVGRAVNLVKRIDQWGKQCGSKEQVLRGWWPGTIEDDDGDPVANGSLMKGRVKAGDKGPLCHRLERLVHLELADLAVNTPYLEPGFPTAKTKDAEGSGSSTPSKKPPPSPSARKLLDKPCPDCTFPNARGGCSVVDISQVVPFTKRYSPLRAWNAGVIKGKNGIFW